MTTHSWGIVLLVIGMCVYASHCVMKEHGLFAFFPMFLITMGVAARIGRQLGEMDYEYIKYGHTLEECRDAYIKMAEDK